MAEDLIELGSIASDGETLTSMAVEKLRSAIATRKLDPESLYSAARLADSLGVSRTPVREALIVLERQRLVKFEKNHGVRVIWPTDHDIREVFELRLLLEVPATQRACDLLRDEDLEELDQTLEMMRKYTNVKREAKADVKREAKFMAHDKRFHEIILNASGNDRLVEMVGDLRDQVRARFPGTAVLGLRGLPDILAEHVKIRDALIRRESLAAARAMHEHVRETGRLLLRDTYDGELELPWLGPLHQSEVETAR